MRLSDFWRLMEGEFGSAYAHVLAASAVLAGVGGRTAQEALAAGVAPRQVWLALCELQEVPQERRLGEDHPPRP